MVDENYDVKELYNSQVSRLAQELRQVCEDLEIEFISIFSLKEENDEELIRSFVNRNDEYESDKINQIIDILEEDKND